MKTEYRCIICRNTFYKICPEWQNIQVNCPWCLSKRDYHINVTNRQKENYAITLRKYIYLKKHVDKVDLPFWDDVVEQVGFVKANRMLMNSEEVVE